MPAQDERLREKHFGNLGPWATALDVGSGAMLSTFWQRRMATMATLDTNARPGWIRRMIPVIGLLGLLALPLVDFTRPSLAQSSAAPQDAPAKADPVYPVWFTTPYLPRSTHQENRIVEALASETRVDFHEMPLQDAVDFLSDFHGIEIELDTAALEAAGVAADAPLSLTVKDIMLRSALRLLLASLDLTAVIHDEVLLITTQDRAATLLTTRTYPVGDLVEGQDASSYDALVKAITAGVQAQSWKESGGPGTITVVPVAHSLVISQTREAHDEVFHLLFALRGAHNVVAEE